ncbi:hypothetical protein EXIGLDRAFT_718121 [Exidia glandulosa HHB12029]|uniref:F-box domain-containing protein n=1 Tax=Exidia glandulosa HHB12029 TaxID=1314781 RepID=A0A165HZB0_EXIGL|nr:hypothetical protein EXIGLDRAFT_718121 [Exidia glandulosa HHB12029]
MHSPKSLQHLPTEILVNVLADLSLRDLHACQATCRRFASLVRSTLALQYVIELEAAGLCDGPPGPLTTAQRMQLVLQRQSMWRTLKWTRKDVVPYETENCLTYELYGRVFGQGKGDKGGATTKYITMSELPSSYLEAPRRYIIDEEQLGIPVWDFTMDPVQDLLVLIEQNDDAAAVPWRVHFRALSSFEAHPRARAATVEPILHSTHSDWEDSEFSTKVFENLVVMLFKPMVEGGSDHIFVWDWTTGRGCQPLVASGGFLDFAILSHDAIVVVGMKDDRVTLDVYTFRIPSDQRPAEDVKKQKRKPFCAASMELPEPTHSDWWNYSVGCLSNCTSRDFNVPVRPFGNSLENQILAFCFTGHPHRATMIVQAKTLLRYAARATRATGVTVAWSDWGERATRWITECCDRDWLCGTHGSRFVTLVPSPNGERPLHHRVQMLDFNPFDVRRFPAYQTPWSSTRIVDEKTVVPAGGLWKHEVAGRLPYREVTLLQPAILSGVMIDECGIVGVRADGASPVASLEIMTL